MDEDPLKKLFSLFSDLGQPSVEKIIDATCQELKTISYKEGIELSKELISIIDTVNKLSKEGSNFSLEVGTLYNNQYDKLRKITLPSTRAASQHELEKNKNGFTKKKQNFINKGTELHDKFKDIKDANQIIEVGNLLADLFPLMDDFQKVEEKSREEFSNLKKEFQNKDYLKELDADWLIQDIKRHYEKFRYFNGVLLCFFDVINNKKLLPIEEYFDSKKNAYNDYYHFFYKKKYDKKFWRYNLPSLKQYVSNAKKKYPILYNCLKWVHENVRHIRIHESHHIDDISQPKIKKRIYVIPIKNKTREFTFEELNDIRLDLFNLQSLLVHIFMRNIFNFDFL